VYLELIEPMLEKVVCLETKLISSWSINKFSDWQGYGKPSGLGSRDSQGRGQGRHLATLEKPLPLTRVSRV